MYPNRAIKTHNLEMLARQFERQKACLRIERNVSKLFNPLQIIEINKNLLWLYVLIMHLFDGISHTNKSMAKFVDRRHCMYCKVSQVRYPYKC